MNLFILDGQAHKAAKYHCDKHVPKMIVEAYQQMGSAVIRHGVKPEQMPLTQKGTPLKGGYHHHPCTKWTGDSRENFYWVYNYANSLCRQFKLRYGKEHFCVNGIEKLGRLVRYLPDEDLTVPALAMPDEFKKGDTWKKAVESYRHYYFFNKRTTIQCEWVRGVPEPNWWLEYEQLYLGE